MANSRAPQIIGSVSRVVLLELLAQAGHPRPLSSCSAGRVRLASAAAAWDGRKGGMIIVPPTRHSLEALTDATVLLTVAKHL